VSARRPLDLQRLRHVSGELLRSRDFRDAVAGEAELLWWHQRAVHDSFGIASGLEVELAADAASVLVAPGVAFDCFGRALQVTSPRTIPLPSEANDGMTLLLRYQSDAGNSCAGAELVWRTSARVDARAGVPLALLDPNAVPSLRPAAARTRPLARPRVAAGATRPDGTAWEPFALSGSSERAADGIEVRIDTRAAGFTVKPCYFAALHWPGLDSRSFPVTLIRALSLQYVERTAADGFTFRIWTFLGVRGATPAASLVAFARREQLYVSWLGVACEDGAHLEAAKGTA
jgi:hypothetical protein